MKMLLMMMTTLMLGASVSAFAAPAHRPFPGPGSRPPQLTCRAYDNGWEEHWGGHGDCRSCLAAHGDCTERCSREEYQCEAEGLRNGRTETYRGRGNDRWSAEEQALRECRFYGRAERCTIKTCRSSSQEVSRRACR